MDNIKDIGPPTVFSILRMLGKSEEEILHVSGAITFKDGTQDVFGNYKDEAFWLIHAAMLRMYAEQNLKESIMDSFDYEK